MDYREENENILLGSFKDDDPYKVSKQLQIKRWFQLYGICLLDLFLSDIDFIAQILMQEDCWVKVDSIEQVKLNRDVLGRKLISSLAPDGSKSPLSDNKKYMLACCHCFEDAARELFNDFMLYSTVPVEEVLEYSLYSSTDYMIVFWSYYINGYTKELKDKLHLDEDVTDLQGFECAMKGRHVQALEYFWSKIQPTLSEEKKEELLINTSLYQGLFVGPTVDVMDFTLRHLDRIKYPKLLQKDFEQNNSYSVFNELIDSYLFDRAQELFEHLNPSNMPYNDYRVPIHNILYNIISLTDNRLIKLSYDMLNVIWHSVKFDNYKKFCIHELTYDFSINDNIVKLVQSGKSSKILSEIIGSFSLDQVNLLKKLRREAYDVYLNNKLFNSEVMERILRYTDGNIIPETSNNLATVMASCMLSQDHELHHTDGNIIPEASNDVATLMGNCRLNQDK